MVFSILAFVALVLPFDSFRGLQGQKTCSLFLRSRGVTALVRTGRVLATEWFPKAAGQDVGHGPREARNNRVSGFQGFSLEGSEVRKLDFRTLA